VRERGYAIKNCIQQNAAQRIQKETQNKYKYRIEITEIVGECERGNKSRETEVAKKAR
jgi:hypothetical protein